MTAHAIQRAQTSTERDSFLDALRAIAILRVVVWHTYGAFWISYFIASLPVMFFVAGSLMATSLGRGNALDVLYRRFRRLLLPLWLMAAAAIALMALYDYKSDSFTATLAIRDVVWWVFPIWDPGGSDWGVTWWAPLWYLRCLTWLLLASPLLLALWRILGPSLIVVPLVGLALSEQSIRAGNPLPWQFQDLSLYTIFWLLGFAYYDGRLTRIPRRVQAALAICFAGAAAAWALTQNVPGNIVNASYPLHLLVALAWLFGALAFRGFIASLAIKQGVAGVIYWVNERALTIYLWHTAGLFVMYQILWARPNSQLSRDLLALPIVVSVTFLAVWLFGWAEDLAAGRSPRSWPSRAAAPERRRRETFAPLALGGLAGAGVAAVALSLATIADEPSRLVQPTAQTVPASGIGLQIRTEQAIVTEEAPPPPAPPVSMTAVTSGDLQAEMEAWWQQWQIAGAAISMQRSSGERWSGAIGFHEDGALFEPDEEYWIGSVTKTFTAALIMRLQEQGLLDLDDPVSTYVPEFPNSDLFTVRQLIQHTSGVVIGDETPYDAMSTAANAGLQSEPGTVFEYSRAGYYLLGLIIEERLDKSYTRALHDELLGALGLTATRMDDEIQPLPYSTHPFADVAAGFTDIAWASSGGLYRALPLDVDYRGIYWSSGGLFSTTSDMAHWALQLWGSDTVVGAASHEAMTTFLDENFSFTGLGTYAFCPCWWDDDKLYGERWGHLGATGAIEYDPADNLALAMHVSGIVTDEHVIEALDDLSGRIRNLVRGRPLALDPPASLGAAPLNRRSCGQIVGGSYTDYLERLWFLDNCVTPGDLLPPTCDLTEEAAMCTAQHEPEPGLSARTLCKRADEDLWSTEPEDSDIPPCD